MKIARFAVTVLVMTLVTSVTTTADSLETYLSEDVQGACIQYGEEYGICPELLMSIIEFESSGNSKAENGGCCGLMQISVKWHKDRMERLGVTDLFDPYGNILVGVDYLSELVEKYQDVGLVLMVYNGGHDYAMRIYEKGELSNYANKILERSAELERLHGK